MKFAFGISGLSVVVAGYVFATLSTWTFGRGTTCVIPNHRNCQPSNPCPPCWSGTQAPSEIIAVYRYMCDPHDGPAYNGCVQQKDPLGNDAYVTCAHTKKCKMSSEWCGPDPDPRKIVTSDPDAALSPIPVLHTRAEGPGCEPS